RRRHTRFSRDWSSDVCSSDLRTLRYVAAREDLDTLELWKLPSNPQRRIAEEIEPGQVLMIEARCDQRAGTMGGMLVARMAVRGEIGRASCRQRAEVQRGSIA